MLRRNCCCEPADNCPCSPCTIPKQDLTVTLTFGGCTPNTFALPMVTDCAWDSGTHLICGAMTFRLFMQCVGGTLVMHYLGGFFAAPPFVDCSSAIDPGIVLTDHTCSPFHFVWSAPSPVEFGDDCQQFSFLSTLQTITIDE